MTQAPAGSRRIVSKIPLYLPHQIGTAIMNKGCNHAMLKKLSKE